VLVIDRRVLRLAGAQRTMADGATSQTLRLPSRPTRSSDPALPIAALIATAPAGFKGAPAVLPVRRQPCSDWLLRNGDEFVEHEPKPAVDLSRPEKRP
jgi:hypothetical protein